MLTRIQLSSVLQTLWTQPLALSVATLLSYVSVSYLFIPQLIPFQDVGRNVCHGSDAVESAKKEIALWFNEGEVLEYKQAQHDWIYEK